MDAHQTHQGPQESASVAHGLHDQEGLECHADHLCPDGCFLPGHRHQPHHASRLLRHLLGTRRSRELPPDHRSAAISLLPLREAHRSVFSVLQVAQEADEESVQAPGQMEK